MNKKPIVLIVDDSASNLQLLAYILQDNYQIKVANNGERGLELARTKPQPDIILLDVIMPGKDGYEVCKELKSEEFTKDIPIIFITGKTESEDEERGLNVGGADYIIKPIRPAIVQARVKNHLTIKLQRDQLSHMALHDPLTELYNRHFLLSVFPKRASRVKRHGHGLCMIVFDIDHFKQVNDQYGHEKGDMVLKHVAKIITENSREEDVIVRVGGEEFVILLEHCDISGAAIYAEKLRVALEESMPEGIKVTASFGVSQLAKHQLNFDEVFRHADSAVYKAKKQGRNCVVIEEADEVHNE